MGRRRANGEGTIYRRRDGRYEGAAYFLAAGGSRKKVCVYGRSREEAHAKLTEALARANGGALVPERTWRLDAYLDHWLETTVRPNLRPKTFEQYECAVRLYLKPALGRYPLVQLSVVIVQSHMNQLIQAGHSVRKVQIVRTALSSALSCAVGEELLHRNVARLVKLPGWERGDINPWTVDEARRFLAAASTHRLYPAFLLLLVYGLRRGEVLGLRWQDIDQRSGELHVRQQLQRIGRQLVVGPVKTAMGRRDLPLLLIVRDVLSDHHPGGDAGPRTHDLVFTTTVGTPIEPRNFVRTFWRLCHQAGVRVIKLHHLRHTAATFLKQLGVPARDAQLIFGHSQVSITQQIYQHGDMESRREALGKVGSMLGEHNQNAHVRERGLLDGQRCRQLNRQTGIVSALSRSITSGGASGVRTHDTLLKRQVLRPTDLLANDAPHVANSCANIRGQADLGEPTSDLPIQRIAVRLEAVRCRQKQWLLGAAAVNLAVKTTH